MATTNKPNLDYCRTERPKRNNMKVTVEMTADTFYEFMQFQKGVTRRSQQNQKDKIVTESDFENIFLRWRSDISLNGTSSIGIFKVKDDDSLKCLFKSVSANGDIGFLQILKIIGGEE